jgi:hypothetical protein
MVTVSRDINGGVQKVLKRKEKRKHKLEKKILNYAVYMHIID